MVDLDIYVERVKAFGDANHYILSRSLQPFERAGLSYRLRDRVDGNDLAPCAMLHVDLTEVPEKFAAVEQLYPRVINGKALSIARELYSQSIVERGDHYAGPVIAKSIYNHRGVPELSYERRSNLVARLRYQFHKLVNRHYKEQRCPHYQVFESLAAVPEAVWENREQMVERFLPGSLDFPITKQRYTFSREYGMITRSRYNSLLCDDHMLSHEEIEGEVPTELLQVRRDLHLDYGAIDFFMIDGRAYVVDANKTTTVNDHFIQTYPFVARLMDRLAEDLIAFVRDQ